jgi:hypothetical protein
VYCFGGGWGCGDNGIPVEIPKGGEGGNNADAEQGDGSTVASAVAYATAAASVSRATTAGVTGWRHVGSTDWGQN